MDLSSALLYESGPVLVFTKPAGISTQSPPGIESFEDQVRCWIKQRDNKPGNIYLALPHRLDRPVSGALLFARNVRAASRLSTQFEERTVGKTYWCLVEGVPEAPEGTWIDTMRKVPDEPRAELVPREAPDAREAKLRYRTLGCWRGGAWLEIELLTGRMHQIRLQASSRGLPVAGDAMYGAHGSFGPQRDDWRRREIALHGRSLSFVHPMTHEPVEVIAPIGESWNEVDRLAS